MCHDVNPKALTPPRNRGNLRFTLSATVRNDGAAAAAATTLRYYRSTDATVTISDTEVGTDAVDGLAASATSSESIRLRAPTSLETYYYGACVDAVPDESDTVDNCSSAVSVTVSGPPPPDLEVQPPSVNDSSLFAGESFTLSATVRNAGARSTVTTATLSFYRSMDATVTTSDTEVGTARVGVISAGSTSSKSISLRAPTSSGTYFYGACVDEVRDELNTMNNCSSAVSVTVSQGNPELLVNIFYFHTNPIDISGGSSFKVAAGVVNIGNGPSAATTVSFYQSTDSRISTTDTLVGSTAAVGALSAGASILSAQISLTAPTASGTYYYGACVGTVTGESNPDNNCLSAIPKVIVP